MPGCDMPEFVGDDEIEGFWVGGLLTSPNSPTSKISALILMKLIRLCLEAKAFKVPTAWAMYAFGVSSRPNSVEYSTIRL